LNIIKTLYRKSDDIIKQSQNRKKEQQRKRRRAREDNSSKLLEGFPFYRKKDKNKKNIPRK